MRIQDTRIYQRSLELVGVVHHAVANLPPGHGYLADQLRRAAASVVLNFAEGYGRFSRRDQRRFFLIAKGSACEVGAALAVGRQLGVISEERYETGYDLADYVAAMLTKFRR